MKKMPSTKKSKLVSSKGNGESPIIANRYKILKKLGSGSYGTAFLISDLKAENSLKVLKKIHIGELEPDETISAVTEARLLSKLDHPGIVKFHDSFIDGEFFCIITEYCEGGDLDVKLHTWKKADRNVDTSLVLTWFIQLVLAVQYMHQRRVLHRDLKTRNIFLKNNMVKIGDFGISRILLGTTDIATTFTGTPYFMAPEILKHEGYNSKSDIWSLGVILYEMCTLKRAFQGSSLMGVMFKIVEGDVPKLPPNINEELRSIYNSMLCKDPSNRISATDILKRPYTVSHLEKLKGKISGNMTLDRKLAKQEAMEIAEALSDQKKKKKKPSSVLSPITNNKRPLTPKEKMKLRKQQKADEDVERLKKVTVSTYNESRRKCTDIKEKYTREYSIVDDKQHKLDKKFNAEAIDIKFNIMEASAEEDYLDVFELPTGDVLVSPMMEGVSEKDRLYTNCFGEDDETQNNVQQYTHCFGVDESSGEESGEENVFFEESFQSSEISSDSQELTNVSIIPEEADLADTYYSTYEDFEDDSSRESSDTEGIDHSTANDDYGALVGCMQNALDLTDNDNQSTFGDHTTTSTTSIRQQKIEALRKECTRLLGEDGFRQVYRFLNKVRFESDKSMSEEAIMKRLRKLVGSTRDCFLVDQLLFLEKQNQIFSETF